MRKTSKGSRHLPTRQAIFGMTSGSVSAAHRTCAAKDCSTSAAIEAGPSTAPYRRGQQRQSVSTQTLIRHGSAGRSYRKSGASGRRYFAETSANLNLGQPISSCRPTPWSTWQMSKVRYPQWWQHADRAENCLSASARCGIRHTDITSTLALASHGCTCCEGTITFSTIWPNMSAADTIHRKKLVSIAKHRTGFAPHLLRRMLKSCQPDAMWGGLRGARAFLDQCWHLLLCRRWKNM